MVQLKPGDSAYLNLKKEEKFCIHLHPALVAKRSALRDNHNSIAGPSSRLNCSGIQHKPATAASSNLLPLGVGPLQPLQALENKQSLFISRHQGFQLVRLLNAPFQHSSLSTKSISGLFLRACCNMGSTLFCMVTSSRTSPCPWEGRNDAQRLVPLFPRGLYSLRWSCVQGHHLSDTL